MTHLIRHNPNPCQPLARRPQKSKSRWILFAPLASLVISLAACSDKAPSTNQPTVAVTDTTPVGSGLKTLAYAVIGGCVVIVMGRLIR